jgi:hypothetical protein
MSSSTSFRSFRSFYLSNETNNNNNSGISRNKNLFIKDYATEKQTNVSEEKKIVKEEIVNVSNVNYSQTSKPVPNANLTPTKKTSYHHSAFTGIFNVQANSKQNSKKISHSNSMYSISSSSQRFDPRTVQKIVLDWCVEQCKNYTNVKITNFSSCWADGLAFCAIIHNNVPDAFDYSKLSSANRRQNFELAFEAAQKHAGITPLLEASDMLQMGNKPDDKCVYTYVSTIYSRFRHALVKQKTIN